MKSLFTSVLALMMALGAFAQPSTFKYQTVVRDSEGEIISGQSVSFQLSLRQGNPSGTIVYTETHNTLTNQFGLANLDIGGGNVVSGNFEVIDWGADDYYIEISFDINGGTNYLLAGTSQLLAVPYALYAKNSGGNSVWQASGENIHYSGGNVGIGITDPTAKFHVLGSNTIFENSSWNNLKIIANEEGSDPALQLYAGDSVWAIHNDDSWDNDLNVRFNNSVKMTLAKDGKLGLGIIDPATKFHLNDGDFRITNGQIDFGDFNRVIKYTTTDNMSIQSPGPVSVVIDNNNNSTNTAAFTVRKDNNDPDLANELFRVQEDGRVGIGTSSPAGGRRLHLSGGDLLVEAPQWADITVRTTDPGTDAAVTLRTVTDGVWDNDKTWSIYNDVSENDKLVIQNNTNKRMTITSDGKVGIGEENPFALFSSGWNNCQYTAGYFKSYADFDSPTLYVENTSLGDGYAGLFFSQGTFPTLGLFQIGSGKIFSCEGPQQEVFSIDSDGTTIVNGNVGIGTSNPLSKLDVNGNIIVRDGSENVVMELGTGLDYAEGFNVSNLNNVSPGMVLSIDTENPGHLVICSKAYDSKVAGIIAGANGLGSAVRLGAGNFDCDVALAGRVYCYVDASNEKIEPGDLLTTSDIPGYAMKVKNSKMAQGAILGKAMEGLEKGSKGQILVLVTLQ